MGQKPDPEASGRCRTLRASCARSGGDRARPVHVRRRRLVRRGSLLHLPRASDRPISGGLARAHGRRVGRRACRPVRATRVRMMLPGADSQPVDQPGTLVSPTRIAPAITIIRHQLRNASSTVDVACADHRVRGLQVSRRRCPLPCSSPISRRASSSAVRPLLPLSSELRFGTNSGTTPPQTVGRESACRSSTSCRPASGPPPEPKQQPPARGPLGDKPAVCPEP